MALVDYGIDSPKELQNMAWRGVTFAGLGLGMFLMNRREYPGPAGAMLLVLGAIGLGYLAQAGAWYWTCKNRKIELRDGIIGALELKGDEKVLDVGCGRGLLVIGAAKKLSGKGKATGVDIWQADDLSNNSAERALANVKAEGMADRTRIETADATALPFAAATFDVVVSGLCVNNIPSPEGRAKALEEIYRVTKPGGKIAIFDTYHSRHPFFGYLWKSPLLGLFSHTFRIGEYGGFLRDLGASEVEEPGLWYGLFPGRIVRAKKA